MFLNSKQKTIGGAVSILAIAVLLSKLLGVLRDRLLAGSFGASIDLDIYFAAFRIPDLIYGIIFAGGVLVSLLPLFSDIYNENKEKSWDFINNLINIFLIVFVVVGILFFVFSPELVNKMVSGFDEGAIQKTVELTRLIFISVVALGLTVLAFQKSPVEVKETQLEEYNHEEIIHLEEEYHTNNETHKDQLADFCSQRGSVAHLIEKIKVKDDTSEMVFVTCIDNEWINQWNPGDQGVLHFYLLNFANSNYDIVWQNKSNSDELNLRSVYSPEIIDIDEDGTEEIVLKGSNWGGTCTGFSDYTYVYSLNYNDIFSFITGKLADHDCNFVPVEPQFSENLNSDDLLKIRNYLENIIN